MTPKQPLFDYLECQRHVLVDMQIPGWDERFLRKFDPARMVELYVRTGADAVMIFANSMSGLTNWPSAVANQHPAFRDRDVIKEMIESLHARGVAVCALFTTNFNQDAFDAHPEWRVQLPYDDPRAVSGPESRFAVCCPANAGFRSYLSGQAEELARDYNFDALFVDMMCWPGMCQCRSCRERYLSETGNPFPEVIDWWSGEWARFQATRERWLLEQFLDIVEAVKRHADIPVFNNNSGALAAWKLGESSNLLHHNAIVGGDVVSGTDELYAFGLLASRLSPRAWQYMHSGSGYISGAAKSLPIEAQRCNAMVATALGGQFQAIDSVLPDGSAHAPAFDTVAEIFATMAPYHEYLGGNPSADVAIFYSLESNVDFRENGTRVADLADGTNLVSQAPHARAAVGAAGALRRAHLPVAMISRADLERLDEFRVVVLPCVMRMSARETAAFRRYVRNGGRLYASGYSSLVDTATGKHDDFALADVYGCHYRGSEDASVVYLRPLRDDLKAMIAPPTLVSHGPTSASFHQAETLHTTLRIELDDGADPLAKLTLPYEGGRGNRVDRRFASTFTSPPWEDTDRTVIATHRFGAGRVIYSASDIEAGVADSPAGVAEQLFVGLIRSLLNGPARIEAHTHPDVWVVPFDEPEQARTRISVFNCQPSGSVLPVPRVKLWATPPHGQRVTGVSLLPRGRPLEFRTDDDGRAAVELCDLKLFEMLAVHYDTARDNTATS